MADTYSTGTEDARAEFERDRRRQRDAVAKSDAQRKADQATAEARQGISRIDPRTGQVIKPKRGILGFVIGGKP